MSKRILNGEEMRMRQMYPRGEVLCHKEAPGLLISCIHVLRTGAELYDSAMAGKHRAGLAWIKLWRIILRTSSPDRLI